MLKNSTDHAVPLFLTLTKLSILSFSRADNYAVVKEVLVIKYDTRETERRAIEMKFVNHMIYFSFKVGST